MKTFYLYYLKPVLRIIILSTGLFKASAQNLIPNGSFELYSSCPTSSNQLSLATSWINPTAGTPEYFNACASPSGSVSIPQNAFGYQNAKQGLAYAGFYTLNLPFSNGREYIQVQLTDSLKKNQMYCVEFYVSLANQMYYATNTIGAYFSKTSISSSSPYTLPYTPQVNNSSVNPLTDTLGWTFISGSFIAAGGERYITIGNFNTDGNSDTTFVGGNGWGKGSSYYYIDSVTVIECDTTIPKKITNITIPNIFTPNNDGTNDVFSITSKNIKTLDCKIYNRWGILVGEIKNANEGWDGRTTAGLQCTDGVYYYILQATGEDKKEYNQKGFVQLVK